MVDDGEPNRRGTEQDEEEDGWGDVDNELGVIFIDVIVVAPPCPPPSPTTE